MLEQISSLSPLSALIALAGGVLSFVSPCVLPLVPLYLGYMGGSAIQADSEAIGARLGTLFQALLPAFRLVGGLLLIVIGLSMLGLFRLPFLQRQLSALSFETYRPGKGSSLLVGMVFAAGWTPCIGPLLASILLLAGTGSSWLQGTALLALYSLGLGIPFMA